MQLPTTSEGVHTRVARAPSHMRPNMSVLGGRSIAIEVERRVLAAACERRTAEGLEELIYETIYHEQRRLEQQRLEPNGKDPRARSDLTFVNWLRHELAHSDAAARHALVQAIIGRYAQEITGHFEAQVYQLATRIVPPALSVLLHGVKLRDPGLFNIEDRVLIQGRTASLRALSRVGTVILAPTHVSNLDSLVLGSAIHRLGLPPFAYGAGLNLFSSSLVGFFMRNLGAYTVDRKKRDPLYRQTLKEYGALLLERGQHSLFFPGGTRSRSGAIESHLKLGLLGMAPVALRRRLQAQEPRPRVFIVPCTLTYPLVLESSSLITDYLRAEGGPHYVDTHDEFERPQRWLDFLRGLTELDLRIYLRVGHALDPMGNPVDDDGTSRDPHGRAIDPGSYLRSGGELVEDAARDAEYTRMLGTRLIAAYRKDCVALPTSVVAFVLFERLRRERPHLTLFRLLRGLDPQTSIDTQALCEDLTVALVELERLEVSGAIRRAPELHRASASSVLEQALSTFARYHHGPVIERRADRIHVGQANLLFYYRNRLDGYGLLEHPLMLGPRLSVGRHVRRGSAE